MDKEQLLATLNMVGVTTASGDMNWNNVIANLLFSAIGFIAFTYGWKQKAPKPIIIGLILMIYPYFVPHTVLLYLIGTVLTAALYFWRD